MIPKHIQVLTNLKNSYCGVMEYTNIIFDDINQVKLKRNMLKPHHFRCFDICNIQFHPHSISPSELYVLIEIFNDNDTKVVITLHDDENIERYKECFLKCAGIVAVTNKLLQFLDFYEGHRKVILQPSFEIEEEDISEEYDDLLLCHHGFPGYEKRFIEVINSIEGEYPKVFKHLVLSCADNDIRKKYIEIFKSQVYRDANLILDTNFLNRHVLIKAISRCLCAIYFYREQSSIRSSSAVMTAVSARVPIIISRASSVGWLHDIGGSNLICETLDGVCHHVNDLRENKILRNRERQRVIMTYNSLNSTSIKIEYDEFFKRIK